MSLKRITKYQNPSNPLPTLEDVLNQQYTEEELQAYKQREEKRKQERAKRFNTSNATRALMSLSSGPAVPGDVPVLDESTLDLLAEGKIKEANQNQQQIDKNKTIASASILSLPLMAGEFATYGALGGLTRLGAGAAGSAAGSWLLGKAGEAGDRLFKTTWIKPVAQTVGGFAGFGTGMKLGYKSLLNYTAKHPFKINNFLVGDVNKFVGDIAETALKNNVRNFNISGNSNEQIIPSQNQLFRSVVYKGGQVKDPYFSFFTTDPKYAKQYGPVRQFLLEQRGPVSIAKEPMIGSSDIVSNDMFINRNGIPDGRIILGHDAITSDIPIKSNGIEILSYGKPSTIKVVNQPSATTYEIRSLRVPNDRPITEAERLGIPKGERNQPAPKNPIQVTLVNRGDEYVPVEDGMFTFESPEKAKKLASIHFTQHTPVTAHGGGNWDSKSTTLLLPYGNMRKATYPLNLDIMDTFFPNYNGLKVKTNGAKVLTSDKNIYDYYKSRGVDVEFSEEAAKLREQYDVLYDKFNKYMKAHKWWPDDYSNDLSNQIDDLGSKIGNIHETFVEQNRIQPSVSGLKRLEKIEGLPIRIEEVEDIATPIERKLGFTYHSTPTIHSSLIEMTPESYYYNELPWQQREFVDWINKHKADYRKVEDLRPSISVAPMTEIESELNSIPPEGFEKPTGLTKMNADLNLFRLQNSKERPILFNKVQDHDNIPVYGQIYPTKEMSLLKNVIEKRIQRFQKKQSIKDFKDLPGKEDRLFDQLLLDNVDKKPIYLTYDDSPSSWLGWFSPKTGKSYINVAKQEPSGLTSLLLHEGVMHPTDDVAGSLSTKTGNIPIINLYKGVSKPSFLKTYPDFTDFSQNWTEARATNGELIHLINTKIAKQFNLPIEHVYRNPKLLEQYVDHNLKTPEDVIKILNDLQSSYSLDYAKRFDAMDAKQKEIYSRRIKDMIKRYPVWLGVLPFLDQEKK